jgi:hypothetical protein
VLSILYVERRNDPLGASVGLYQLEKLLGWPERMLEFHTWYLKEKGWIQRTDSGGYAITVEGIDVLEHSGLTLGIDRLLPGPDAPVECPLGEADEATAIGAMPPARGVRACPRDRASSGGAASAVT